MLADRIGMNARHFWLFVQVLHGTSSNKSAEYSRAIRLEIEEAVHLPNDMSRAPIKENRFTPAPFVNHATRLLAPLPITRYVSLLTGEIRRNLTTLNANVLNCSVGFDGFF